MKTNILIAEFMGGILSSVPNVINLPQTVGEARILCVKGSECLPNGTYSVHRVNELQYHKSWDWLIPVIKQVREITNVELSINDFECVREMELTINPYDYTIEQVYQASVDFIKWYNNLNK